jgi:hypothetical protein
MLRSNLPRRVSALAEGRWPSGAGSRETILFLQLVPHAGIKESLVATPHVPVSRSQRHHKHGSQPCEAGSYMLFGRWIIFFAKQNREILGFNGWW